VDEQVFLGRSAGQTHKALSGETAKMIDEEVRRIIDECYAKAQQLLEDNVDKLHAMARALMLYETIDSAQIDDIMAGREPREPAGWGDDAGGAPGAGATKPRKETGNPIGGPASEH
jgi:cell division protease FtsH